MKIFVTAIVLLLSIWAVSMLSSHPALPKGSSALSLLHPFARPLFLGEVSVSPLEYRYWKFEVSDTIANAQVVGNFHASGGQGDDIEAALAAWDQCENWMNGHPAQVLYTSGKTTNGVLNIPIRQAGIYCLVFSNKMSLLSRKTVSGDIALRYLLP